MRLLSRLRSRDSRTASRRLGDRGEGIALRFLEGFGYRIVATNVVVPLGRSPSGRAICGEVDIVAYDGTVLAFVEVKTRVRPGRYPAEAAVDAHKRRLLARSAARYRRLLGIDVEPFRFDVVTVLLPSGEPPRANLLRGYFSGLRRPRDDD